MNFESICLSQWIIDNAEKLQPPVCNALIHNNEIKTMIVGGPNVRTDYHLNLTDELFYQLQGDIVLRVVDAGEFKSVPIRAGEVFLLPGGTPHSPQRSANSIGLVFEVKRTSMDGLRWYCGHAYDEDSVGCGQVVHEQLFECVDLVSQLKEAITGYYSNAELRTCRACGKIDERPTKALEVVPAITTHGATVPCSGQMAALGTLQKITTPPLPFKDWTQTSIPVGAGMHVQVITPSSSPVEVANEAVIYTASASCMMESMANSQLLPVGTIVRVPKGTYLFSNMEGQCIVVINKL